MPGRSPVTGPVLRTRVDRLCPRPPSRKRSGAGGGGNRPHHQAVFLIVRGLAAALITVSVFSVAACGGADQPTATLYFERYGETLPSGQVRHVLAPVVRVVPENDQAPARLLAALLRGPTAAERKEGFVPTLRTSIRVQSIHVSDGVATVNFGAHAPEDFYAHASVVLSLTELPGIRAVALRSNGKPCCVYNHESKPIPAAATPSLYHGWSGEPCELRTYAGAIACEAV